MIDWNKRNGGFLSPESVYENQLGNLAKQINDKDKEIEHLQNIIKEVREYINWRLEEHQDMDKYQMEELLEILDKKEVN